MDSPSSLGPRLRSDGGSAEVLRRPGARRAPTETAVPDGMRRRRRGGDQVVRLNAGCGERIADGWLNCDVMPLPDLDFCADIVGGLPLDTDSVDCIAAIHVLQDLAYPEVVPALRELRRVLRRGGVLRIAVMDFDRAVRAYQRGDARYFGIPDAEAASVGAKLIARLLAYGAVRTPFNEAFARESLLRADFTAVYRCAFGVTESRFSEVVALDSGEQHSLFLEAVK